MKLATTTGDFEEYTHSQLEAMEYIKMAGFKYLDYNFCADYRQKSGIYGQEDFNKYIESVIKKCDELKVKFVQAHAPMGVSFGRNDEKFIEDTKKSIRRFCATDDFVPFIFQFRHLNTPNMDCLIFPKLHLLILRGLDIELYHQADVAICL